MPHSLLPAPGNHFGTLCLLRFWLVQQPHVSGIRVFVFFIFGLFHLVSCFQSSSMLYIAESPSILRQGKIPLCMCVLAYICTQLYHILLIHSSVDGHLGCFQGWANLGGGRSPILFFKAPVPRGCSCKESACQCRRRGFHPWVGRSPGVRKGNPLQYSGLENPMDRRAWWATAHGVTKSGTRLSD